MHCDDTPWVCRGIEGYRFHRLLGENSMKYTASPNALEMEEDRCS